MNWGKKIKKYRKKIGKNKMALARESGLTSMTITNFEKGLNTKVDTMEKICEALGLQIKVVDNNGGEI